jgi:glutamate 5-kinase
MFTDNDELSGLFASMMDVDALLLLSNIDGLYDGDPADPHSSVIRYIHPGEDLKHFIKPGKSTFGRGGMLTKSTIARKVAEEGITVYIANGKKESILLDLLDPEKEPVCTQFLPGEKSSSAIKKWIAHSEDFAQGAIHINEGCFHALTEKEASSILPIGITRIEGHFEKGDIIQIIDHTGRRIGVGLAQYGSSSAEELLGKKGEKPLVHYDYLYIDIPD